MQSGTRSEWRLSGQRSRSGEDAVGAEHDAAGVAAEQRQPDDRIADSELANLLADRRDAPSHFEIRPN